MYSCNLLYYNRYVFTITLNRNNRVRVSYSSVCADENRGHLFHIAHASMHVRVNTAEKHYPERHGTGA